MLMAQRLSPALGAILEAPSFDEAAMPALAEAAYEALMEHQVLFFRDQELDLDQHKAFGRRFGQLAIHPASPGPNGHPEIVMVHADGETNRDMGRTWQASHWHTDVSCVEEPPMGSVLHMQTVPPFGGDTLFASMSAAYDALSPQMRAFLTPLKAVNDFRHGFRESLAEPGGAERLAPAIAENPPVEHPLVCTHPESGRKAIYANALFTTQIVGLPSKESDALLAFLYQHVVAVEHTVRLSWQPGTVAIWDNRSTQHKPVNDFFPQHRLMHRVTLTGDQPV